MPEKEYLILELFEQYSMPACRVWEELEDYLPSKARIELEPPQTITLQRVTGTAFYLWEAQND
jgi:hypothetical protein